MFFGSFGQTDPMREVRNFVRRVEAARRRPPDPEELRGAVQGAFAGPPRPGPALVVSGQDMAARMDRLVPSPAPPAVNRVGDPAYALELRRRGGLNGYAYVPGEQDVHDLARLMYAEALGVPEDFAGVGWVAVNRTGRPDFAPSLRDVIHQPGQFEVVREGNRSGRDSVHWSRFVRPEILTDDEAELRKQALTMAEGILSGRISDPTDGATFFRSPASQSKWFDGAVRRGTLVQLPYRSDSPLPNRHLFYDRN
jgi:hypothetical protein